MLWGLELCWELWFWIVFGISACDLVGGFGFGLYLGFGRCFVYCGFDGLIYLVD